MGYKTWFDEHAAKHQEVVTRLIEKGMNKEAIIDYFDFNNMLIKEPSFCPLYVQKKKCHDIEPLNCYLCACPNFRFDDSGIKTVGESMQKSVCDIESKDGKQGLFGNEWHQDCSGCGVPHRLEYVKKQFNYDWLQIMQRCNLV